MEFTTGLSERYPELYEEGEEPSHTHQVNFGRKWGGYQSVIKLTKDNIMGFDEVLKQPLEKCLLYLSYHADLTRVQKMEQKMIQNKYKS